MKLLLTILVLSITALSCKKYLDRKSDQSLVTPSTLKDLQVLLDNNVTMNTNSPSWGLASSDDYFLPADVYASLSLMQRKAYTWEWRDYESYPNEWAKIYNQVYPANVVLESIHSIPSDVASIQSWNNIKGSALVFRAQAFLRGVILFAKAYDKATAQQDPGIVLRLNSDFNEPSLRASSFDSYKRILQDLKEAAPLLPGMPIHVMRPSKNAAFALLARTYLAMGEYDSAWKYADQSLQINSELLDYNNHSTSANFPFQQFNKEIIFHSTIGAYLFTNAHPLTGKVDTTLYQSYATGDLRKSLFFRLRTAPNIYSFKGLYNGDYDLFVGIANDEVYLTRAECYARKGDVGAAMADLNALLIKRWKSGSFTPFTAATSAEALSIILTERRKELIFRDLRWMDIKRLNREGYNIVLKRKLGTQEYILSPNDNRYALQIPADIIRMTGISQNP